MSTKKSGVIYILTNPSFPQYVKIGYANNLESRLRQLNRSEALPYAFRAYATYDTDHRLTDKALHELIDRLNPDLRTVETFNGQKRTKEFFEMSAEDAYSILEAIARISGTEGRLHRVTPTGEQAAEEEQAAEAREHPARRAPFRFSMVGLKPGDVVTYASDATKTARVVDDKHVVYLEKSTGEEVTSTLSGLAEKFSGASSLQGPRFFSYDGELLSDRRIRMEKEHE